MSEMYDVCVCVFNDFQCHHTKHNSSLSLSLLKTVCCTEVQKRNQQPSKSRLGFSSNHPSLLHGGDGDDDDEDDDDGDNDDRSIIISSLNSFLQTPQKHILFQ